jgi:bifunctional DNase/RNase
MSEMIEVMIDSIRVSLTSQQRVVLLRSLETERYLPIWIGPYEAESITIALQEIELARPQTHDLLLQMLTKMGAHLRKVEITSLKEDVFYGNLVVEKDDQTINIDARPSDSIALAVRAHVPIFMSTEILDVAGITPDADLQQEPAESEKGSEPGPDEVESDSTKKRLSVFEDFLQNLDIGDDMGKGDNPDGDPESPETPEPPEKP